MTDNGTGMDTPPNNEPSGAVTSREATRKNPKQGFSKPYVKPKIDINSHGIRRETTPKPPRPPKKTGAKKV